LIRDFGFQEGSIDGTQTDEWWRHTLRVEFPMPNCASIFGINPGVEHPLEQVETAFESWKGWRRASSRFFEDLPDRASSSSFIHAPFFQRAANIWSQIYEWLHQNDVVGEPILKSLHRGIRFKDWDTSYRSESGLRAAQAIYAFCGGQEMPLHPSNFDGLFGGYQAYNYYCNSHFVSPGKLLGDNIHLVVSQCNFSNLNRMPKLFAVNTKSGDLVLLTPSQRLTRAVKVNSSPNGDELLIWMEEFAHRLSSGQIGAGTMGSTPLDPFSITLYPRWPSTILSPAGAQGAPACSCAVTRGVEVIGSAVYAPQAIHQFGFIYSIRIRLVTPNDRNGIGDNGDNSNYISRAGRGFDTCQLRARHWRITNFETGNIDQVNGEGVIGMYPIFREGGYTDAGDSFSSVFQYQSCTGPIRRGSFGGTLEFVPGTIASPTGRPFQVELEPFLLDDEPAIIY
jgi:uncharacterized protein affecting Mg2+/Co2+ transport